MSDKTASDPEKYEKCKFLFVTFYRRQKQCLGSGTRSGSRFKWVSESGSRQAKIVPNKGKYKETSCSKISVELEALKFFLF
jgi:hypothetical protein